MQKFNFFSYFNLSISGAFQKVENIFKSSMVLVEIETFKVIFKVLILLLIILKINSRRFSVNSFEFKVEKLENC